MARRDVRQVEDNRPRTSLGNERGAALLLTVYFCSVTLFVMSALSLQRTNLAMRAAQVSRDLQQAFWLAEAAMDSAAVRLATEQLVDGVPYEISSVTGKAAFTLYTDSAAITAPSEDGSARMKLTRRIVGQGTAASGVTSSVSAYFTQEGPAQGVWGNGMVVAHGGAVHPDVFFTGSMRSQLGAMASVVDADASLLRYHGVAQAADLKDLAARSSQDLVSLKNGYKYLQGIAGEDDSGMKYVEGSQQMSIPYVSGEATIGELPSIQTAQLPTSINPAECQGTLYLETPYVPFGRKPSPAAKRGMLIGDGFNNGEVRDLTGTNDGRIVMCVKAIVPKDSTTWLRTILNNPPSLTFLKPTTLYVTGSRRIDISDSAVENPYASPDLGLILSGMGVQMAWDMSVAARISTVGAQGLDVIATEPITPGDKNGLLWIKPGKFTGSVYAPQSLVLFRARDAADAYTSSGERDPIVLQSLVGNEVIVEMYDDQLIMGGQDGSATATGAATPFLGWQNASTSTVDSLADAFSSGAGALNVP